MSRARDLGSLINSTAAGKNKIINGDFSINQRQFTSTTTNGAYTFDRWLSRTNDSLCTFSAQTFLPGEAPVSGYEASNFMRLVTSGQTASSTLSLLRQFIEGVRSFAGQTVTVSFWARAVTGSPLVNVSLTQFFGSSGSSGVETWATPKAISTSWARYSWTINVPSISGKTISGINDCLSLSIFVSTGTNYPLSGMGIQSNTFDFWGVQVEAGSSATQFSLSGGDLDGELSRCQRYYWRWNAGSTNNFSTAGFMFAATTTAGNGLIPFPTTMRTTPTLPDVSAANTFYVQQGYNATVLPLTAISFNAVTSNTTSAGINFSVASGLVANNIYYLIANNTTSAFLGFSAEF